ncbi:MAG: hypothetical protein K0U37_05405 [Gammaproteobacteria bacterium]|nr:hypothetical protein [Gammaproteobacteria bacterium]
MTKKQYQKPHRAHHTLSTLPNNLNHQHIKDKALDDWFMAKAHDIQLDITKDQNAKSPLLANQLTGRYGLRDATALRGFLNSPGGKALKSLIASKMAELEALRKAGLQNKQVEQRARGLVMLILGLAHQKEAAAHRLDGIFQQKVLDNKLHPKKNVTQQSIATQQNYETALAYEASAHALSEELTSKENLVANLDQEWNALEASAEEHKIRDAFLDTLLVDITRLFTLSPDEKGQINPVFDKPELKNIFKEKQIVHKDGKAHLIPKGVSLDTLSPEEQTAAQKAFLVLKPRLEKAVKSSKQDEAALHEKRKMDLIHRATRLHQDIRVLTQQLIMVQQALGQLQLALTPQESRQDQLETSMSLSSENNTNALSSSYKLLYRESLLASTTAQRAPLFNALHNDIDPLDLETIHRSGGPQFLPELHQFKQGGNASHQPTQTLRSLLRNAESLAALISEAPTARRFQIQEEKHEPQPLQQQPEQQLQQQHKPEQDSTPEPQFNPSPFSTKPY